MAKKNKRDGREEFREAALELAAEVCKYYRGILYSTLEKPMLYAAIRVKKLAAPQQTAHGRKKGRGR